ncbi:MAG TPA: GNAT family N-acetyltransferase [Candidatus Acidoferrales bacterium]|nr:GNAT family N-acetyltransferase [Candidatus Acidoferrales bacterium]
MKIRRARPAEAPAIHALIAGYAAQGLLLPRTPEQIRAAMRDFLVAHDSGRVMGCAALEFYGPRRGGLAEVRSLAVAPEARETGLGGRLLEAAVKRARRQGAVRVFAVTRAAEFFERHEFSRAPGGIPEEKVARDCTSCPKAAGCRLQALSRDLAPAPSPQMLNVLAPGRLRRAPAPA